MKKLNRKKKRQTERKGRNKWTEMVEKATNGTGRKRKGKWQVRE